MTLNEGDRKWRSSSFKFSYFIPKVTGRSSYRSFLTGTCPFMTVKTVVSLAPVLAQYKMWNRYPWGVPVLGWEGWAHGTTPFSPAHQFFKKKNGPELVHGTMLLLCSFWCFNGRYGCLSCCWSCYCPSYNDVINLLSNSNYLVCNFAWHSSPPNHLWLQSLVLRIDIRRV